MKYAKQRKLTFSNKQDGVNQEISTERKQTDLEYFEYLCRILLPTDYQLQQYKEYLRLKGIFEKDTDK